MNQILLLILSTIRYSNCYTINRIVKECGFKDNTYLSAIKTGIDKGILLTNSKDIIILSSKGEKLLSVLDNIIELSI